MFHFQNNWALKCQILSKIFPTKLLKTGFVANDKWRQVPGFDLLHHKGQFTLKSK